MHQVKYRTLSMEMVNVLHCRLSMFSVHYGSLLFWSECLPVSGKGQHSGL